MLTRCANAQAGTRTDGSGPSSASSRRSCYVRAFAVRACCPCDHARKSRDDCRGSFPGPRPPVRSLLRSSTCPAELFSAHHTHQEVLQVIHSAVAQAPSLIMGLSRAVACCSATTRAATIRRRHSAEDGVQAAISRLGTFSSPAETSLRASHHHDGGSRCSLTRLAAPPSATANPDTWCRGGVVGGPRRRHRFLFTSSRTSPSPWQPVLPSSSCVAGRASDHDSPVTTPTFSLHRGGAEKRDGLAKTTRLSRRTPTP